MDKEKAVEAAHKYHDNERLPPPCPQCCMADFALSVTAEKDAEIERLTAKLAAAEKVVEWYADESAWFTPKFCIDYLHGHAGHVCSKNWAFLGKGNGYDKAAAYLKLAR